MITVGVPTAAEAPQMHTSPTRKAGIPPIKTVVLPIGKGLTVGTWPGGGIGQTCWSVATAAGIPPMRTVAFPGPIMVPPCVLVSVTLAAGGMATPSC